MTNKQPRLPADGGRAHATDPQPPDDVRIVDAETIFHGAREIVLMHNGQEYRLRITAQNKLILTK